MFLTKQVELDLSKTRDIKQILCKSTLRLLNLNFINYLTNRLTKKIIVDL